MQLNYTYIPPFPSAHSLPSKLSCRTNPLPSGCCQACAWNKCGCSVKVAGTKPSMIHEDLGLFQCPAVGFSCVFGYTSVNLL